MGQASRANSILPVVAIKPGEYSGLFSMNSASLCPLKTAQFKGDAGGVKKDMLMEAIFGNGLFGRGDGSAAYPAEG